MDKKEEIPKTIIYNDKNLPHYENKEEYYTKTDAYQMTPLIKQLMVTRKIEVKDGTFKRLHSFNIPYVNYLAYRVIKDNNFSKVLDIGTGYGISMLYMLEGLKESKVDEKEKKLVTIDPYQNLQWENGGLIQADKSGLSKYVEFYEQPSADVLPEFYKDNQKFDFVFLQGFYLFDYIMTDIFYINKLINVGGVLIIPEPANLSSTIFIRNFIKNNYKNWKRLNNSFIKNSIYLKIKDDDRKNTFFKDFGGEN
jgi:hypothetical protein